MPRPLDTIELFYAHALAIEREGVRRYAGYERHFRERGEALLAALCGDLAAEEGEHLAQLERASRDLHLPPIDSAQHAWLQSSLEGPATEVMERVATPRQLLKLALRCERRAWRYFRWAARSTASPRVRTLARRLACEEREHVKRVLQALDQGESARSGPPNGIHALERRAHSRE